MWNAARIWRVPSETRGGGARAGLHGIRVGGLPGGRHRPHRGPRGEGTCPGASSSQPSRYAVGPHCGLDLFLYIALWKLEQFPFHMQVFRPLTSVTTWTECAEVMLRGSLGRRNTPDLALVLLGPLCLELS